MGEELVKDSLAKIKHISTKYDKNPKEVTEEDEEILNQYSLEERDSINREAQKVLNKIDGILAPGEEEVGAIAKEELSETAEEKPKQQFGKWIKMTIRESKKYQEEKILVGYNPSTEEGLLKS